jgi:hypothetical protein
LWYVNVATASSPDVLETSSRERAAAAQLDDARAQVKPTFSWLAAYQFRGGLDPMVMGGFSVRLPVWKDRKQEHAIAGAVSERAAAGHDREAAEVRARAAARELAVDLASIDVRLRLYREAIVPQASRFSGSTRPRLGRAEMFWCRPSAVGSAIVGRSSLSRSGSDGRVSEAMTGTTLLGFGLRGAMKRG